MDNFANYLFKARCNKKRYISQGKLAELSGYSQTYISLIETGKANPSLRCKKAIIESLTTLSLSFDCCLSI